MVRIDIGGTPILDIDLEDTTVLSRSRQTYTHGSSSMHFSWHGTLPRLVLTSDTTDFDQITADHFRDEGFQVSYLPYTGDHKVYQQQLFHIADALELGDKYAIVAYGDAASHCLAACNRPMPKLCALVAYYPPYMPKVASSFPSSLKVQIHLAGSQNFGTKQPSFRYDDTKPGFAEHDLEEFDKVGSRLAWSRTLGLLRACFGMEVDLEEIWDNHTRLEFGEKDADATMKTMVAEPYVNHVPTMTGGIGAKDLRRFYADYFIPGNPPDMKLKILSRTVGVDRVVDEMLCTFTHTKEVPWMLPGVPATDKHVEVVVMGVICIRGGKLYHEHISWDQASVLLQVGLIDPSYIPPSFTTAEKGKEKEMKKLPVVGAEGARKVVDEEDGKSNELIPGW